MSEQYEQVFERWRQRCEELQAKIDRLQTLQPKDVTPEELEAVRAELPHLFVSQNTIAAVCREMLREAKGDG